MLEIRKKNMNISSVSDGGICAQLSALLLQVTVFRMYGKVGHVVKMKNFEELGRKCL